MGRPCPGGCRCRRSHGAAPGFRVRLDPSSGCGSLCQAPLLRLTRPAVPVDRRHGGGFPPGDGWQARVDRTVKRCTRDLRVAQALAWVAGPRLRRQHSELRREPLLRRIIDRPFALTNAFESRASSPMCVLGHLDPMLLQPSRVLSLRFGGQRRRLGQASRLAFWRRHLDYARHSLGSRRMRRQV